MSLHKALIFEQEGKYDEALYELESIINDDDVKVIKSRIFKKKGQYEKGIKLIDRVLQNLSNTNKIQKIKADVVKSEILLSVGKIKETSNILENTEKLFQTLDKENQNDQIEWKARIFQLKGIYNEKISKLDTALDYLAEALKIFEQLENKQEKANTLYFIGFIHEKKGKFDKSLNFYDKSLKIRCKLKNQYDIANSNRRIGTVWAKKGNLDLALKILEDNLKLRYEIGDNFDELSKDHSNIGMIYRLKGNLEEALGHFKRVLSLSKDIRHDENLSVALTNIGTIHIDSGQLDEALDHFKQAYVIMKELGDPFKIALLQRNIGLIYRRKGEFNLALDYYKKSLENRIKIGNDEEIAKQLNSIGILLSLKGELETALNYIERSLIIWERTGSQLEVASVLNDKAIILQKQAKYQEAEEFFRRSLKIRKKVGDEIDISETLFYLVLLHLEKETNNFETYFKELQKISKKSKNKVVKIRSRLAEAAILHSSSRMSKKVEAHELFEQVLAEGIVDSDLTIFTMLNLCEFLILELKGSGEREVLIEIQTLLEKLYEIATEQESHSLLIDILILQSKLALLEFNFSNAGDFLTDAREIAEKKGLNEFLLKISYLQHELVDESAKLSKVASQIPMQQRMEQLDIENYIKEVAQIRDLEKDTPMRQDIKNFLQINQNFAQLLLLDDTLPEDMRRYVHFIDLSAREMQLLISTLLTLEKIENKSLKILIEDINCWELLKQRINFFSFKFLQNEIVLDLDEPGDEIKLKGDKFLIRRIFDNLIHNAGKFTPKNGKLKISVEDEDTFFVFKFTNDSLHIPIEYHETIFQKYGQFTFDEKTRKMGVGLGLAFCKQAIELLGGEIYLISPIPGREDGVKFVLKIKKKSQ